jgi:hypothetical protein
LKVSKSVQNSEDSILSKSIFDPNILKEVVN